MCDNITQPNNYANDINLFYLHRNIKKLFETANSKLQNVMTRVLQAIFPEILMRQSICFFHKQKLLEEIPLSPPDLIKDKGNIG